MRFPRAQSDVVAVDGLGRVRAVVVAAVAAAVARARARAPVAVAPVVVATAVAPIVEPSTVVKNGWPRSPLKLTPVTIPRAVGAVVESAAAAVPSPLGLALVAAPTSAPRGHLEDIFSLDLADLR